MNQWDKHVSPRFVDVGKVKQLRCIAGIAGYESGAAAGVQRCNMSCFLGRGIRVVSRMTSGTGLPFAKVASEAVRSRPLE